MSALGSITADSVAPGVRILVVEDEPAILDMLSMSLAFVGYDVSGPAPASRRSPTRSSIRWTWRSWT